MLVHSAKVLAKAFRVQIPALVLWYRGGEIGKHGSYVLLNFIRFSVNICFYNLRLSEWLKVIVRKTVYIGSNPIPESIISLGSCQNGLCTSLQNLLRRFDSATALTNWDGSRGGQCGGLKILRCAFDSHPSHNKLVIKKMSY